MYGDDFPGRDHLPTDISFPPFPSLSLPRLSLTEHLSRETEKRDISSIYLNSKSEESSKILIPSHHCFPIDVVIFDALLSMQIYRLTTCKLVGRKEDG
jgi:hypothetical protein